MSTMGLFNTSNFNPHALPDSVAKTVLTKYPFGMAQLFALSAAQKTEDIASTTHTWMSKVMVFPKVFSAGTIGQGIKGATQTIEVDNTRDILPKDILLVSGSDEQIYVESILGETQMIVRRGMGISPALPIPPGTRMTFISNAFEEGSLRPGMRAWGQEEMSNSTQIFRNGYGVTGTATAVDFVSQLQSGYTNLLAGSKADCAMYHALAIEHAMIFGELHVSTANGQPLRKMDGLLSMLRKYAPQNVKYAASTTTRSQFDSMTQGVFDVNTDPKSMNDRVLYTGNAGFRVIQEMIRAQGEIQIMNGQTTFGLKFATYQTIYGGTLQLMTHPLLNTNPEWSRMALIVDVSSMSLKYLRGRRTRHQTFNQNVNRDMGTVDGGIDAEGGDYLSELTMEVANPEANAVIYGLRQAACEPCIAAPTVYEACFEISDPCEEGAVEPGATITLQISHSAPESTVTVSTPTGAVDIVTDVNGLGAVQYTMPIAPDQYAFVVQGSATNPNIMFMKTFAIACINGSKSVRVISNSAEDAFCTGVTETVPMAPATSPTDSMIQENNLEGSNL